MGRRKNNETDRVVMIKWGITHQASDEEIAKVFGYQLSTWKTYKSQMAKTHPDLVEELLQARGEKENNPDLIERLRQAREGKNIETLIERNTALEAENATLKAENQAMKIQIAKLEMLLQSRKILEKTPVLPEHEETHTPQFAKENELDVLLRCFETGKVSKEDAERLKIYYQELQLFKAKREKLNNGASIMEYANMLSFIRTVYNTMKPSYQEKTQAELRKFVSSESYGPLYELEENVSISELAKKIEKMGVPQVSTVGIAMLINQMQSEGRGSEISDKINLQGIDNMRSRIEDWYEKLEQDILAGGKLAKRRTTGERV